MLKSTIATASLAAFAGAAMLTLSMTPASAFTLAAPSLAPPVASALIDHVWWDRWGRWHPGPRYGYDYGYGYGNGYGHGYGFGPGYYGPGPYRGGRHCWRGYYGRLHCRW